jgi:hypothetical protein
MTPDEGIMKIAQRARYDLYFLCKYVLGYELMEEEVHGDLCKYVETLLPGHPEDYSPPEIIEGKGLNDSFDARKKNMLILMPRGTFKSSVVTIGFSLQIALNEPNARILIDSETQSKAKAFLSEVKATWRQMSSIGGFLKQYMEFIPTGYLRSAIRICCGRTPKSYSLQGPSL